MKKLFIAVSALFLVSGVYSQKLDRSKPPKSGPAPVISLKDPVQFKLANGMTVLVVENHKLPKVSATLSVDTGPVTEGDKAGVMSLMGGMLSEGTKDKTKAVFDEEVDRMGANVNLSSRGGSASSLTRYFDKTFMLLADAVKNPAMQQSSFDKLKTMAITALKTSDKSAAAISSRVVDALSYGPNNPMGEFQTEQSLNSITLQDVKDAYKKYITPSRAFLTFVGDITPAKAKALADKAFASWKGSALKLPVIANVANPRSTEIDLVDVPTAVQSEITVTNLINLPMSSPDYFPVLIANQILGGGSTARLFMNLREKHGFTYGAYSSVGTGRYQTTFDASASVRNDKVDSAVAEILSEIERLRTEKVTEQELHDVKALYTGNFALSLENPALPASFASNIIINNLDKNFYRNYLKNIDKVTVDDVLRVAKKYFNYDNTRIVVVGKADVVKSGLEKLGYPVKMFDKYAAPVTATAATAPAISAKEVIEKYLSAIGGVNELNKITTMHSEGSMTVQGMSLKIDEKMMAPNLIAQTVSMNGQPVMQEVFDGEKGWRSQMGNKMDYSQDELNRKKDEKSLFNQVSYLSGGYNMKVTGVEKVDGSDAYKLQVTAPSGAETTEWYDVKTGYLVKVDESLKMMGQEINQTVTYSNYKKAGNIMVPYTLVLTTATPAGAQDITVDMSSITLNAGVTKDDFK